MAPRQLALQFYFLNVANAALLGLGSFPQTNEVEP